MSAQQIVQKVVDTVFQSQFARDTAFLLLVITICYLAIARVDIPTGLLNVVLVAVGFYFGKGQGNGGQNTGS